MIKATDLRIGNYVVIDNDKYHKDLKNVPVQVIGIEERKNKLFPDSKHVIKLRVNWDDRSQFEEFIKPIPLTEDVLSKTGLTKAGNTYSYGRLFFNMAASDKNIIFRFKHGYERQKEIYFLHDLQNFIKQLTGEELTINF